MRVVNQFGYSLIELLIGLSVSVMVTLAALSLMTSATVTQTRLDAKTSLSLELSRLMTMIESDISRAGLCYQCGDATPFKTGDHLVLIDDIDANREGQCIRFAYQQTSVIAPLKKDRDDVKGFRFDGQNQAIEIYENHKDIANWSCQSGYWRDISSRDIVINALNFKRKEATTPSKRIVTSLTITLSAALKNAPHTQETLSRTMVLHNTMDLL
ncbi:PulJ/GspJ family protein [Salinivibrio socompensis]|uniref:PulJ/GspJ family protein n=1 Tax=Salinivibrio socompensis TaxID=1510206 RepID=UPI000471DA79|nr:hypothetical protein [Salinivibrio socompensis]